MKEPLSPDWKQIRTFNSEVKGDIRGSTNMERDAELTGWVDTAFAQRIQVGDVEKV